MPDLTSGLTTALSFIPAAAGLGTAAMGVVGSSEAFAGGPSNLGFGFINKAIEAYAYQEGLSLVPA